VGVDFGKQFDQDHPTPMADWTLSERNPRELLATVLVLIGNVGRRQIAARHAEQFTTEGKFLFTVTIPKESVVPNTLKSIWKNMQQKTADEFLGRECHCFPLILPVVLPSEGNISVVNIQQAIV